jgi:hypothetical protein
MEKSLTRRWSWGLLLATIGLGLAAPGRAERAPAAADTLVKILVERDGVYRVSDKALRAAGWRVPDGQAERLRLRLRGAEVPLRLITHKPPRGAGRFALDFAGRYPRGTKTYEDPYNARNVYLLDLAPPGHVPLRYADDLTPDPAADALQAASPLRVHFEANRKLMRFSGVQVPDETWYWDLAMASDPAPKAVSVRVQRVDAARSARLRVGLQGYSALPQSPDHHCDVFWNGAPLGQAVWDGQAAFVFEHELPPGALREGGNVLSFQVTGENTSGLDVVLLDWIELDYTQRLDLERGGQLAFGAEPGTPHEVVFGRKARVSVFDTLAGRVRAMPKKARRLRFAPVPVPAGAGAGADPDAPRFWAVREGAQLVPAAIGAAHPLDLRAQGSGADFIIVTHPEFRAVAERLAAQRRREGLVARVVSVDDVYDGFGDGFLGPEPIRAFLRHAWQHWQPRPRYALLLGDASWDYKNRTVDDSNYPDHEFLPFAWNTTVPKISSTPLKPGDGRNDRQRVPTFQWQSPWGHAASDNFFARVDGDDDLPDLALGRIPAGTLAEAEAAVDKILDYGRRAERPPAREGVLFITDQYQGHQVQTDRLAESAAKLGYAITKIYPRPEETDNAGNSAAIRAAFDAGQTMVVFAGHGGRYIWRTGPPDPQKNHDLFTLEHLDQLHPAAEVPVVISLTCYSAPFDHPTADSIGEKMLRLPRKGAVAVVASSWRNVPPFSLADQIIVNLGVPGEPRLGDAFLKAMREIGANDSVHTYNLLGDPTMPFRAPAPPPAEAAQTQVDAAPAPE